MAKYDRTKSRNYDVLSRTSESGRSSVEISCPFCPEIFTAYIWSICGGGKKCPRCGAIHNSFGTADPVIERKK